MNSLKYTAVCLVVAFLAAITFSQTADPAAPATRPDADQIVYQEGLNDYHGCEDVATDGDMPEENLLDDRAERGLGLYGDQSGNWAFLRFNDLKLPAGRKLDKVELVLTIMSSENAEKSGLAVHRLIDKLNFAQVCFAYRDRAREQKWGTTQPSDSGQTFPKAGVDYREKPEAIIPATGDKPQIVIDLTAAVREWIADPAQNNGLVIRPLADQSVGWVASSQQEQSDRPKLVVHLVPEKP